MKNLFTLLLILCFFSLFGQTAAELEQQLGQAETNKEKMLLNYKLGDAYLRVDTKKALGYARQSHNLATQQRNNGMAARSAYLMAIIYERKRDTRNTEVWLKSSLKYAKAAGDSDLIIKSVEKRSKLATKQRNYRRAYQIVEEAFNYFSQNGVSISDLESKYDLQKAQLERQKRQLEQEKARLESEISVLSSERDQLGVDKSELEANQDQLVEAKKKVEEQISVKEEELANVSEAKKQAEAIAKRKEREVKKLTRKALEQEAVLESTRADLAEAELEAQRSENIRKLTIGGAGFAATIALLLLILYRSSRKAKKKLEGKNKTIQEERERSDELLLNILPSEIADELKQFGKAKARKYNDSTVLFSDFKNFTLISEQLSPEELVEELDKCFKAFDFIISQYKDIEKIKTIGDAYMCASGLSTLKKMPYNIIKAALEMQEFLEEQKQERLRLGKPYFEARIGIHTGAVVAGVVGVNKFAYDIWGDTVNIAARMESKSRVGHVNISETTYNLVRYKFDCEYRGKVEAKNKGLIDMYFVNKELVGVPA